MKNIKPFGPSILKAKIPDEIIVKLNDYVDQIINDNQKSKSLNYGTALAGDVTQEFKLEKIDLSRQIIVVFIFIFLFIFEKYLKQSIAIK